MAEARTDALALRAPEERGTTEIADRVVERIAAYAAGEVDGTVDTRDGLTGLVKGSLPRVDARVAGQTSRIGVEVAARWPLALAELGASVRDHVTERVGTLAGVTVTAVDVSVAEVVRVRHRSRRVE